MRRFAIQLTIGLLTLGLAATAAWARGPLHMKSNFSGSFQLEAGEFCDFAYGQDGTAYSNALIWGDPDNPTRVIDHQTQFVSHTNLETGYSLHEVDHLTFTFNAKTARFKQVGVFWHLRTEGGKIVVVQAGQLLFDTDTGEILKMTPNINPDVAAVICPALGGHSVL